MRKVQTSSTDHPYKHWSCNVYLKRQLVLSFYKKLLRYQNSQILWYLNVIPLSNLYMYIMSLQVEHGLGSFLFFKIAFTLNCWLLCLLGCLTSNIENTITFATLE